MSLLRMRRMENQDISGTYPEMWLVPHKLRWLVRFLIGRPMDNVVRTNATFWRDATSGWPSRWLRLAGWKRSAVRVLSVQLMLMLTVLSAAWALGAHTFVMSMLTYVFVSAALIVIPLTLTRRVRAHGLRVPLPVSVSGWRSQWALTEVLTGSAQWEREKVIPLGRSLAGVLNRSAHPNDIRTWVSVPRDYRSAGGKPVVIGLPLNFHMLEKARASVVSAIGERLGMSAPSAQWQLEGEHPRLLVSAPPLPPERLSFDGCERWLMSSEQYRPFLGLVSAERALTAEMISDSPHIGVSAGPGAGKSTLAKLVMMQALRWGWGVIILDWKKTEAYKWAIGLPGVTYVTDIEKIHDMGVRIGQEVDIRKNEGMSGRANVLVIRDEWNATADLLMAFWQDLRSMADPEDKKAMPLKSPGLRGFMALDFAGREFGMFDFLIAQRFSSRIFNGNADMRECFQIKCLARYSPQTKQMLVGNMRPFPKKSNHPGRWTVVAGEDVAVIQVPLITGEEARNYAMDGIVNPITPLSSSYYPELDAAGGNGGDVDHTLGEVLPPGVAGVNEGKEVVDLQLTDAHTAEVRIVDARKLSEMVDGLAPLGVTLKILRHAAGTGEKGDSAFPGAYGGGPTRGYTYDYQLVKEWARRRHASQQARKEIGK